MDALSYKANILTAIFDLPEAQFNKVIEGMLNGDIGNRWQTLTQREYNLNQLVNV